MAAATCSFTVPATATIECGSGAVLLVHSAS